MAMLVDPGVQKGDNDASLLIITVPTSMSHRPTNVGWKVLQLKPFHFWLLASFAPPIPIGSMELVYIYLHESLIFMVKVGKYTLHGFYRICFTPDWAMTKNISWWIFYLIQSPQFSSGCCFNSSWSYMSNEKRALGCVGHFQEMKYYPVM